MKVLLTGSNGMVGRNILEHRSARNYTFLTPSSSEVNLLNSESIEAYCLGHRPDVVIHCAGLVGGIQANMKMPVRFLTENLEMGKNILLAADKSGASRVLNVASSCMYPKDHQGLLEEDMILTGPLEPTNEGYAIAKIATMRLGQYLNKESGTQKYKTLIPCNLYGRWDKFGDQHSHMIPAVIKKVHQAVVEKSSSVEIWGSGNARREFMDAADVADFVFFALDNWAMVPEIINVGLGYDYTINEYYQAVARVLGYEGGFHHDLEKPEGMKRKVVSVARAQALGWKSTTTLEEGIRKAYEFYLENKGTK